MADMHQIFGGKAGRLSIVRIAWMPSLIYHYPKDREAE